MTNINKSTNSFILKNTYIFCLAKHVDISFFIFFFQMSGLSSNSASSSGVGNDVAGKAALFRPYALPPSPSARYLDRTSPHPPVAHRVVWGTI